MYPKLYNSSGQLLAVLDNIIKETASIKRVVNGEFTFTFEAYEKELKSEYFDQTNNVVVDGQTFDIKYIEETHKREHKYSIQCEHVNYRLTDGNNNLYTTYANTGTPAQILADILSGTEFSVGVIEFTDAITISANAEITKKALIYQLAGVLGGELEYTNGGFTINILANIGKNNGFQARFGKNLDGITKIIDARGGLKTYYEVDIIELKNSNEYIEKDLSSLEVMDVGDTVQLIDKVIGLDVQNRIVSRQYNPIFAINTKVEIANTIELITDKINQIDTSSVKQNKLYNNVSISRDYGFRAERSDKLARATLGGGQISLDSGDGAGNYTPAVYFDVVTHKYKFIGDIVMEGGSISWDTVEKPNVSWDSVTDKPDIGDVALGRINSTYMDANGIWTPKVYATNISALLGKITVAQIEQLEVGTNVTMGPNASISWSQVSSRPYIPSTAADVGAIPSTYIDAYGVFTPMVYASNLYGTAISGKTLENVSGYTKSLIDSSGVHLTNKNSGGTAQIEKLLLTTTWDYDNEGTIVFTNNNSQQAVIDFDTSRLGIITSGLPLLLNGSRVLTTADSMTAKFA